MRRKLEIEQQRQIIARKTNWTCCLILLIYSDYIPEDEREKYAAMDCPFVQNQLDCANVEDDSEELWYCFLDHSNFDQGPESDFVQLATALVPREVCLNH